MPTHYRGVVVDGEVRPLDGARASPTEVAVAIARRPALPHDDGYEYDAYHAAAGTGYVVPLEVVFRNAVPPASSLRDRYAPREAGLDRETWPDEAVNLPEPLVELSTKFEAQDRYLDRAETARVAGRADLGRLERLAEAVNGVLTDRAARVGLTHLDGKIEVVYDDGTLRVADVAGTFDENRYTYDGHPVSKEALRAYHRTHQSGWVAAEKAAKRAARAAGETDWCARCDRSPDPLPGRVAQAASDLYATDAETYTGGGWFDAPALDEAVAAVRAL